MTNFQMFVYRNLTFLKQSITFTALLQMCFSSSGPQLRTHTHTHNHHSNMCKHTGGWWTNALPLTQMHTSGPSIQTHAISSIFAVLLLKHSSPSSYLNITHVHPQPLVFSLSRLTIRLRPLRITDSP